MPTVEVRDVQGKVLGERELPEDVFGAPVNVSVMHQVVVAGAAGQRAGTHSTKTRAEVSGGGRKPWRQKGTGRARHGSNRSPIWAGGGVAHGPKPRNYDMRVNRKMKRAALRSALSDAVSSGKLGVVEGLSFDGPRTKDAAALLEALGFEGLVLLVIAGPDQDVEKSFRNLPQVKVDYPGNLSTYDVLYADRVLFTTAALDAVVGERGTVFEEPAPDSSEDESEEASESEPDEASEDEEVEP